MVVFMKVAQSRKKRTERGWTDEGHWLAMGCLRFLFILPLLCFGPMLCDLKTHMYLAYFLMYGKGCT